MPLGAEAIGQALSADAIGDGGIVLERLAEVAAFHIPGGMGMALHQAVGVFAAHAALN